MRTVLGTTHSPYETWPPKKATRRGLTMAHDHNGTPGKANATAIVAGEIRILILFQFVQCFPTDRRVECN